MIAISEELKQTLSILPDKPGVYQYFDENNELIYVGKAKNLKRRVNSYFNRDHEGKVLALVRKVRRLEYIVVDTEADALLLENNLIKRNKPHYNILLKDDKTYPWLCLSNEEFPRLFPTRRIVQDGSVYFGPYPSVKTLNTLLEIIHEIYPLRTCRHRLDENCIASRKVRLCLEYHMKRCAGPCQGLQTQDEYNEQISQIKALIRGHITPVLQSLTRQMMQAAEALEFKKAQLFKTKIELLQNYQSKSTVVNPSLSDLDVLGTKEDGQSIYFNYLHVVDGRVIQAHTIEVKKKLDETPADLLEQAIVEFRQQFDSKAPEIILPFQPSFELKKLKCTVPQMGEKKKLLELSLQNIKYFILEKSKRMDLTDPDRRGKELMAQLQKALGMEKLPLHIECFDNSNFEGDYPVGAMTVSRNGKLSKRDYRHFNIRTVQGANDYATMEEVFTRHYGRLIAEGQPLPQLIIVDGGKGQITSAYKVLSELGIEKEVFLIGIAERLEEIYKPGDPHPLLLDKKSEALRHIQLLRDEAHRFGITHYRKRHLKGLIKTELTEIKGIGADTASVLLHYFHSVKKIKETPLEELQACVGKAKAELVWNYFHT
ncbi:MAG: excinuclease ABC subunit UvrC [Bacteroides sp.]|nr:excinuclease ABC subunit UvrC [Ruminococcus flavefaciens]MCM1555381.1 excinuclease ABC subunit UvrC [Bacteroides sp.]